MGYQTYFSGEVSIEPPLNEHEISFLQDFNKTRRMHRTKGPLFIKGTGPYGQGHDDDILNFNAPDPDQPGLWCQWTPSDDGTMLAWDQGEKFYYAERWMKYIIENLLAPSARAYIGLHLDEDERLKHFTCDHVVDGEIYADGEESDDFWKLIVDNNVVKVANGIMDYADPQEI